MRSTNGRPSIRPLDLPDDIYRCIVEHLSAENNEGRGALYNLAISSRTLHQVSTPRLYQSTYDLLDTQERQHRYLCIIMSSPLHALSVREYIFPGILIPDTSAGKAFWRTLAKAFRCMKGLVKLRFKSASYRSMADTLLRDCTFQNLKVLTWLTTDDGGLCSFLKRHRGLIAIQLVSPWLSSTLYNKLELGTNEDVLPSLESICTEPTALEVISHGRTIQRLRVIRPEIIPSKNRLDDLSNVRWMWFDLDAGDVTDMVFEETRGYFRKLEVLRLRIPRKCSNAYLTDIIRSFPNLRRLMFWEEEATLNVAHKRAHLLLWTGHQHLQAVDIAIGHSDEQNTFHRFCVSPREPPASSQMPGGLILDDVVHEGKYGVKEDWLELCD